jgi:hydrogenase expression/formation protein HypE
LVGGHTEVTPAVAQPVMVGQMLGFRADGRFIRTGGVRRGDIVLQIGPAPIEGAAVLAVEAAARLVDLAPEVLAAARDALDRPGISVVEPALCAAELGATALHDPTEGGLSAGLYELAEASGLALRVDADAALWFEPGKAIAEALGADPWGMLASGSLLAAFPAADTAEALAALRADGHTACVLGRAETGAGVYTDGGTRLPRYEQDEISRILTSNC